MGSYCTYKVRSKIREDTGKRRRTDHVGSDDDLVRERLVERPLVPLDGPYRPVRALIDRGRPVSANYAGRTNGQWDSSAGLDRVARLTDVRDVPGGVYNVLELVLQL